MTTKKLSKDQIKKLILEIAQPDKVPFSWNENDAEGMQIAYGKMSNALAAIESLIKYKARDNSPEDIPALKSIYGKLKDAQQELTGLMKQSKFFWDHPPPRQHMPPVKR